MVFAWIENLIWLDSQTEQHLTEDNTVVEAKPGAGCAACNSVLLVLDLVRFIKRLVCRNAKLSELFNSNNKYKLSKHLKTLERKRGSRYTHHSCLRDAGRLAQLKNEALPAMRRAGDARPGRKIAITDDMKVGRRKKNN